ncbi:MAG: lytic transglycosylase domain-containing protein [Burkholderiaceae bacterium]|nr:lytic transglycosylase domain-containing protein [Burkholderiaceae bacterium]
MRRQAIVLTVLGLWFNGPSRAQTGACVAPAAQYHKVNPQLLDAILAVESGHNPRAIGKNTNGTTDWGIGQINTIHLDELRRHGIGTEQLLDACKGTYVAAWLLARQMRRYGNTWFAVGAYHSATPSHNQRYQTLVQRQLARAGAYPPQAQESRARNTTR